MIKNKGKFVFDSEKYCFFSVCGALKLKKIRKMCLEIGQSKSKIRPLRGRFFLGFLIKNRPWGKKYKQNTGTGPETNPELNLAVSTYSL